MICLTYKMITMIIGFTAVALYHGHCTRKIMRAMDRGLYRDPKDDR